MFFFQFFCYALLFFSLLLFNLARLDAGSIAYVSNLWYQTFQADFELSRSSSLKALPDFKQRFFYSPKRLAYVNPYGEVVHFLHLPPNTFATPAHSAYLLFQKAAPAVEYYQATGSRRWRLEAKGYPFLSPNATRFLLVSTDNFYFSLYNQNRQLLRPRTFLQSVLTSLAFSPFDDSFALATMNGELSYYSEAGALLFKARLEGSEYNYIKTISVSEKGNYVAALGGLYPEYLSLHHRTGALLWKVETGFARRSAVPLWLHEARREVYTLAGNNLKIRQFDDPTSERKFNLAHKLQLKAEELGTIRHLAFAQAGDLLALGVKLQNENATFQSWLLLLNLDTGAVYFKRPSEPITRLEIFQQAGYSFLLLNSARAMYLYQLQL